MVFPSSTSAFRTLFLFLSLVCADLAQGRQGRPLITNYTSKDFNAFHQNWISVQDQRGVMFFGNGSGVLEFDGVDWRLTPLQNGKKAYSLTVDREGRIFVGSLREFGYLAADSVGMFRYVSLVDKISEAETGGVGMWGAYSTSRGVYFTHRSGVYRWTGESLVRLKPESRAHPGFVVRDTLYIRQWGRGLTRVEDDSLHLLPGGELFAEKRIVVMTPYSDSRILAITNTEEFYIFDGASFQPFIAEAATLLGKNQFYSTGTTLPNGNFALAAHDLGIVIIDRQGKLIAKVDKQNGLLNNTVRHLFVDSDGGLWAALEIGLSRIEIPSPFKYYDEQSGINGNVLDIAGRQNTLFLGTGTGVAFFDEAEDKFRQVPGIAGSTRRLLSFRSPQSGQTFLLAANRNGVYEIENKLARKIAMPVSRDNFSHSLKQSALDSSLVFIGLDKGLAALRHNGEKWLDLGKVFDVGAAVLNIAEPRKGELWFGVQESRVVRLRYSTQDSESNLRAIDVAYFSPEHGLPYGKILAFQGADKPWFLTRSGAYAFDDSSQFFFRDNTFPGFFENVSARTKIADNYILEETQGGDIWLGDGTAIGMARRQGNGVFQIEKTPYMRFSEFAVNSMFSDENEIAWFGGLEGVIRYDGKIKGDDATRFSALVRRVFVNDDSLIFGGNFGEDESKARSAKNILNYEDHNVLFECAATTYEAPSHIQYQYFLEGFENRWSQWTKESKRNYTNLPEGDYRFRVRAKNIYARTSSEDVFVFSILPPWSRTWWAYGVYILLFVSAFYGVLRYEMSRQRFKHNAEIERLQAEQQQREAEKLKELDRMKSQFFANISHEFRTPLTLILGPVESLLNRFSDKKSQGELGIMQRNAGRLLRLINQLLDLSKLEAGKMTLRARRMDFLAYLKGVVMAFESLALSKSITLQVQAREKRIELYFDPDKIEKIFSNLISNALKFTPEGGRIVVQCLVNSRQFSASGDRPLDGVLNTEHSLLITVRDSGVGISPERLPHIFDRFYQVDDSNTRVHEGSGVGLALVKELVDLHSGDISVRSELGAGTTFTVLLPFGKAHLKPGEIIEESSNSLPSAADVELLANADRRPKPTKIKSGSQKLTANSQEIILLIEDNPDMRAFIRRHLESAYQIIEACDGEKGVAKAIENVPDLVISDVMMPKMDGFEVCAALKNDERTSHIPVILLTAKAEQENKIAGLEIGADDYLLKPFNAKELLTRVGNLITLRRKLRERFGGATTLKPSEIAQTSKDRAFLERALDVVEKNLTNEEFDVETLAAELTMSYTQLHRKLKALTNQSSKQFILSIRLQRAADLLKKNAATISEIAYQTGFGDPSYFTRRFKKHFGCSPSVYSQKEKARQL